MLLVKIKIKKVKWYIQIKYNNNLPTMICYESVKVALLTNYRWKFCSLLDNRIKCLLKKPSLYPKDIEGEERKLK